MDSQLATTHGNRCSAVRLYGYARGRYAVTYPARTSFAFRETASLKIQLALFKDVWSRMQNQVNSRSWNQFSRLENLLAYKAFHLHTSKFRHVAVRKFRGVRHQESAAREGRIPLPPLARKGMPAGGSRAEWHSWQTPHFTHHHRSPQAGQILNFMDAALLCVEHICASSNMK